MCCAQAAAKRAIQAAQRMEKTARIKCALLWRKKIEQRKRCHYRQSRSEPVRKTCFRLHVIHVVSCAELPEHGQAWEIYRTDSDFKKNWRPLRDVLTSRLNFAVRRFA
jgi:hypothetical protein